MTAGIRWYWSRLTANYWFYPALFAILAAALAQGCVFLDRSGQAEWLGDVEWLVLARPTGAADMLQIIATSMITIAATVFSITIVAVSFASGTYGPRLLTNFMEDRGNQLSLATFIGTFVFALTVLRTVRAEGESAAPGGEVLAGLPGFVPQLSLLVAYLLAAISIGVLVFFLNHIPSGIRIDNVLHRIGKRLIDEVCATYPQKGEGDAVAHMPSGSPITAERTGYVQLIDFHAMEEIARTAERRVVLSIRTGDFLHRGLPLAEVCDGECGDALADKLRRCVTVGFARTPAQDPQFLIDELVEIGLRALSPGINDPFTAITALHWLGAATAELACRDLVKNIGTEEGEDSRVFPLPDDFAHYVRRGFGSMRSAVATSPIASDVMFACLRDVALTIDSIQRRQVLFAEGTRLRDQAREALSGPALVEVEQNYNAFARKML